MCEQDNNPPDKPSVQLIVIPDPLSHRDNPFPLSSAIPYRRAESLTTRSSESHSFLRTSVATVLVAPSVHLGSSWHGPAYQDNVRLDSYHSFPRVLDTDTGRPS